MASCGDGVGHIIDEHGRLVDEKPACRLALCDNVAHGDIRPDQTVLRCRGRVAFVSADVAYPLEVADVHLGYDHARTAATRTYHFSAFSAVMSPPERCESRPATHTTGGSFITYPRRTWALASACTRHSTRTQHGNV